MGVTPLHWAILLVLVALWGSSYLMVAVALTVWSPAQITGLRVFSAALVLVVAMLVGGKTFPRDLRTWAYLLGIAIIGNCVPFFLISWGQQGIDTGLAGILAGSTPLVVLVLAHFLLDDEPMTRRQVGAFALGFMGIVVLMEPDSLLVPGKDAGPLLHQLAVLGGAVCYALATVAARLMPRRNPVVVSACVMLLASGIMGPYSFEAAAVFSSAPVPGTVIAAIGFLGLLGTGVASILYFYLITETGARFTSYLNYLVPVWAIGLGAVALGESVRVSSLLALALILSGLLLGHGRRS
jgi:drug/metabolite transporter (DMT)-like permease